MQELLDDTPEFDYLTHIVFRMYESKQVCSSSLPVYACVGRWCASTRSLLDCQTKRTAGTHAATPRRTVLHELLRALPHEQVPVHSPLRFRVEISFSPGAAYNPVSRIRIRRSRERISLGRSACGCSKAVVAQQPSEQH